MTGAGPDTLLLAVPRPAVLLRCIEQAAALGFGHVVLFRSWRVDKSHLAARALAPERLEERVQSGLRQARRSGPVAITRFDLFRPFVEDHLDGLVAAHNRFVAHPEAERACNEMAVAAAPMTVAIGPERGFTAFEIDLLATRGFEAMHVGKHPLRVETALVVAQARMALLRDLASRG